MRAEQPRRLDEYRRKRNFRHTPEPRGAVRSSPDELHYVVQKHHARRLHYDLRLELDGTLKSWAVPNGPGKVGDKRLAVHVEDHPLDYAKFEGVIPAGHYGAGKVEIWDEGLWRPQGNARAGYRKGHLAFELEGKRLHGAWDLVRVRPKPGELGKDNWLLTRSTGQATPARKRGTGRVLYPAIRATKLDLVHYYDSVGEWILPHLRDRPLSVVRCPRGPAHKCFFQRHSHETMPGRGKFIVADNAEALAQLVQMGVIELHTWGSRAANPLAPDRIVFDLDPDADLPWGGVVDGAMLTRTLLSELRLESFVKTTGGKGLHVVVPLQPEHSWKEVKDFSRQVAEYLAATLPGQFTAKMGKGLRRGRIFIDYLRNQKGATTVAAYSVRAREVAPVSVPLAWDELSGREPMRFDLRTILARLKHLNSDPWYGYAEPQRLTQEMRKML